MARFAVGELVYNPASNRWARVESIAGDMVVVRFRDLRRRNNPDAFQQATYETTADHFQSRDECDWIPRATGQDQ